MSVLVELEWSEGEPAMSVDDFDGGLRAVVDVRLSASQVDRACAELGAEGIAVAAAWRERVGLSPKLAS